MKAPRREAKGAESKVTLAENTAEEVQLCSSCNVSKVDEASQQSRLVRENEIR